MIAIVVATSLNSVIGCKGDLPWHLRRDLQRFRALTTGRTILMGRTTWDSIIGRTGYPLPNRRNLVLSRQHGLRIEGGELVHSVNEAVQLASGELIVIGGAAVYQLALPLTDRLYVTRVNADVAGDAFFPMPSHQEWRLVSTSGCFQPDQLNDHPHEFLVFERLQRRIRD